MRLLLDNNLSLRLVDGLAVGGHDAVHVRDLGLAAAADPVVMSAAYDDKRVLVTGDTDFGTLLAQSGASAPSVVLLRMETNRRPAAQVRVLLANLPQVEADLEQGCLVVIDDARLRVRRLPLLG